MWQIKAFNLDECADLLHWEKRCRISSMPSETKKAFRVQMRYNLRIISFLSELTLETQRRNKDLSKLKEKLLAQIAMELQVKDLALEYSYFKGLMCFSATRILGSDDVQHISESVNWIHSHWRKQEFCWCQRNKMTFSLPANQHHEISV